MVSNHHFITSFPQNVSVKINFENRSIFGEYMDKSLQLTFMGHPVDATSHDHFYYYFQGE